MSQVIAQGQATCYACDLGAVGTCPKCGKPFCMGHVRPWRATYSGPTENLCMKCSEYAQRRQGDFLAPFLYLMIPGVNFIFVCYLAFKLVRWILLLPFKGRRTAIQNNRAMAGSHRKQRVIVALFTKPYVIAGWFYVPYIMLAFQWKTMSAGKRIAGVVWSLIVIPATIIAIAQSAHTQPAAAASAVHQSKPVSAANAVAVKPKAKTITHQAPTALEKHYQQEVTAFYNDANTKITTFLDKQVLVGEALSKTQDPVALAKGRVTDMANLAYNDQQYFGYSDFPPTDLPDPVMNTMIDATTNFHDAMYDYQTSYEDIIAYYVFGNTSTANQQDAQAKLHDGYVLLQQGFAKLKSAEKAVGVK